MLRGDFSVAVTVQNGLSFGAAENIGRIEARFVQSPLIVIQDFGAIIQRTATASCAPLTLAVPCTATDVVSTPLLFAVTAFPATPWFAHFASDQPTTLVLEPFGATRIVVGTPNIMDSFTLARNMTAELTYIYAPIPEPGTWLSMACGLAVLSLGFGRRAKGRRVRRPEAA